MDADCARECPRRIERELFGCADTCIGCRWTLTWPDGGVDSRAPPVPAAVPAASEEGTPGSWSWSGSRLASGGLLDDAERAESATPLAARPDERDGERLFS